MTTLSCPCEAGFGQPKQSRAVPTRLPHFAGKDKKKWAKIIAKSGKNLDKVGRRDIYYLPIAGKAKGL